MTDENENPERGEDGRFLPGHTFYRQGLANLLKEPRKFETPEALWAAACEYFEWADKNPFQEERLFNTATGIKRETVSKIRAYTVEGLCTHLGVIKKTWYSWKRERGDLEEVIGLIDQILFHQKFEAAAADLMNSALVIRALNLADTHAHQGPDGGPIEVTDGLSDFERARRLAFMMQEATILASAKEEASSNEEPDAT